MECPKEYLCSVLRVYYLVKIDTSVILRVAQIGPQYKVCKYYILEDTMPVSQAIADNLLAEFIALRGKPVRYKRTAKGPKQVSLARDPLAKVEFEPDNSRIGRESRGIKSGFNPRVGQLFMLGASSSVIARAMVEDWYDAAMGICKAEMTVTVMFTEPVMPVERTYPVGAHCILTQAAHPTVQSVSQYAGSIKRGLPNEQRNSF